MSKELDEFYKSYSARIIAIDDTPSVEVMDGDKFKLLSIEEYEEMTNKIADLETKLAEKEKEIEYQESMKILAVKNQNQKAIEQLEKVKEYADDVWWVDGVSECVCKFIDQQINELKGKVVDEYNI